MVTEYYKIFITLRQGNIVVILGDKSAFKALLWVITGFFVQFTAPANP